MTLAQANSASFVQIGNAIALNASPTGKLSISISGNMDPGTDSYGFTSKGQYTTNGGVSWADATTATASSLSDTLDINGNFRPIPARLQGGGPVTIAGLGADTPCMVRFVLMRTSGTTAASSIAFSTLKVYAEQVA